MGEGFDRLERRLTAIRDLHLWAGIHDLMERWERIIEQDNRMGVLANSDKDGKPAPPLKYRPKGGVIKLTVAQRLGQRPNKRRGIYTGAGDHASGINNNLTSTEYRHLDGPRLAPQKQFSRVITDLATGHGQDSDNPRIWFAEGVWVMVMSKKGVFFLKYHFDGGIKNTPPYDLQGIRPAGIMDMRDALREWGKSAIRELYKQ